MSSSLPDVTEDPVGACRRRPVLRWFATGGGLLLVYLIWGPASPRAGSARVPGAPGDFISAVVEEQGWEDPYQVVMVRLERPGGWFEDSQEETIGRLGLPPDCAGQRTFSFSWRRATELSITLGQCSVATVVLTREPSGILRATVHPQYP